MLESTSSIPTIHDTFGNTFFNLLSLDRSKETARTIKELIPQWLENGKKDEKHMILLTLAPEQTGIHKYALDSGFGIHHGTPSEEVLAFCLKGHSKEDCNYPKYQTVSLGVTGVVFNQTLDKFVAIKQTEGPYKDWKAPTGIVKAGEDPLNAVVRRLFEETAVQVNAKNAMLVGKAWTPNFRGTAPDINFVFAFSVEDCDLKGKEDEIKQITWLPVSDFEHMDIKLSHNKPFIISEIVKVAQNAMQNQTGWQERNFAWGSGKDATLFS